MLTDDELDDLYLPGRPDSHHAPAYIKAFARAVIAKIEAKLREQEPFAWYQPVESDKDGWIYIGKDRNWMGYLGTLRENQPLYKHPAPIPEGWQPISTAPKDGITILAKLFGRRSESTTREVLWNGENWITRDGSRFSGITHWMKLPAPPMTTARSE